MDKPSESEPEDWAPFFHRLADAAAAVTLPHFRRPITVENKDATHFDPVTAADRAAEQAIKALVVDRFPDHGFVGEEFGAAGESAEWVWVVDPIDGTRAFISGLPVWGTLIGLKRNSRPVYGMMAQPFTGERFFGNGRAAQYAGPDGERTIATRACPVLAEATLFTTSPGLYPPAKREAFDRLERDVRLSRYGVDCYAFAMVAAGFVDIAIECGVKTFDILALIPVVEGAGGIVTTWTGGYAGDGGDVIASGDARTHEAALRRLA